MISHQWWVVLMSGLLGMAICLPSPGALYEVDKLKQELEAEPVADLAKQGTGSGLLMTILTVAVLGPLLSNFATGVTNGMSATMNNRTLEYIPVPSVSEYLTKASNLYEDERYAPEFYRDTE